jgi:hypothetical protein
LANFVAFRLQHRQRLTGNDYHDFPRTARWKVQHRTRWKESVGDYLDVLDEKHPGQSRASKPLRYRDGEVFDARDERQH